VLALDIQYKRLNVIEGPNIPPGEVLFLFLFLSFFLFFTYKLEIPWSRYTCNKDPDAIHTLLRAMVR